MLVIPAIDLIGGECVRLKQGRYEDKTVYNSNPLEVVLSFVEQGAEWIHVVDLDGAKAGKPMNLHVLREIHESGLMVKIEYGGGVRSDSDLMAALAAGAERVVLGSVLTKSPQFARDSFVLGEKVVAGIDTLHGKVAIHGWQESTEMDGTDFAKTLVSIGCQRIIWTDISTDGMLRGPNLEGLRNLVEAVNVPVVASGGVAELDDLKKVAETGAEAAIVGMALYEGRFSVEDAIAAVGR